MSTKNKPEAIKMNLDENIAIQLYKIRRLTLSIGFSEAKLANQLDKKRELSKKLYGEEEAHALASNSLQEDLKQMITLQNSIDKIIKQLNQLSSEISIEENELQSYLNTKKF